jgi:hypothetical protein
MTNCVFQDNPGQETGGIRTGGTVNLTLTNVTFYNNTTTNTTDGAAIWLSSATTAQVRNSILYGNISSGGGNDISSSGTFVIRNSLVGDRYYDRNRRLPPATRMSAAHYG